MSCSNLANGTKTDFSLFPMTTGFGFYFQNKLSMLNMAREWYYDKVSKKLYMRTLQGDSPRTHKVEVSTRPYAILVSNIHYITITGIKVEKAAIANIETTKTAGNIVMNDLDVFGGNTGVRIGSSWTTVEGSSIGNSVAQGIVTAGVEAGSGLHDISILNNQFSYVGNAGTAPVMSKGSLYVVGDNVTIRGNEVRESGYLGIRSEGKDVTIDSNIVDRACITLDDCGGILTWGEGVPLQNVKVINNTVKNMIGNKAGTPYTSTATRGIYLDGCAYGVSVRNNKVENADYGIHVHSGNNNMVTNNEFFARRYAIVLNEDGVTCGDAHDNQLMGNTYSSNLLTDAPAIYYSKRHPSTVNFGVYDYNRYCLSGSQPVINDQYIQYTLPAWQNARGQDLHSTTATGCTPTP